jgi:hypothetical protein
MRLWMIAAAAASLVRSLTPMASLGSSSFTIVTGFRWRKTSVR